MICRPVRGTSMTLNDHNTELEVEYFKNRAIVTMEYYAICRIVSFPMIKVTTFFNVK